MLVVDDEEGFVEALARRLDKRGFRIATATSGKQALDYLAEEGATRTDVIVLDVKMPGRTGLDLLQAVKEMSPETVVIMITAFVGQGILLEASLSYLGLGVQEPTPAWGLMLQGGAEGRSNTDPFATEATADNEWLPPSGPLIAIIVPHAAALEGLPTHPDDGVPWVMYRDTPYAHIMVPIED